MSTTVHQEDVQGVRVVRVSGSLTQQGVDAIESAFAAALPDGARAVVDLGGVDLITTPGLTMIISTSQRLHDAGGRVVFTAPPGNVRDLLRRCRLDEVLELAPDRDRAVTIARA